MRSSFLTRFGVGLLAGSVRAGPCKPHGTTATTVTTSVASSSSWTVGVSSSTIVFSAETTASSTILESDITEPTSSAADTATTTDVEDTTTTSAVPTTTTSEATTTATDTSTTIGIGDTTTTELTKTSEATTSAMPTTTTADATTSADPTTIISESTTSAIPSTTISEIHWPLGTFGLVHSQTSGPLMGIIEPYSYVNFGASGSPYTPLGLTIEPETDRIRIAGGLYLCIYWEPDSPGALILCENEEPWQRYIECSQADNGELSCSGEVVLVTDGPGGLSFASTDDHVTHFLVKPLPNVVAYNLYLGYGPTNGFDSVTLKAVQAGTQ